MRWKITQQRQYILSLGTIDGVLFIGYGVGQGIIPELLFSIFHLG